MTSQGDAPPCLYCEKDIPAGEWFNDYHAWCLVDLLEDQRYDFTALYRMHDRFERLLYVGITKRSMDRFSQHASNKPWWAYVARIDIEHFPTRGAALEAERLAIRSEAPLYNKQHAT